MFSTVLNQHTRNNRTINIKNGDNNEEVNEVTKNKVKCGVLVQTIQRFVNSLIKKYFATHNVVYRSPVLIQSEEDENGYISVTTIMEDGSHSFRVLNKSGEIVQSGDFGYVEYRKSVTNSYLALRNGKPRPKGGNDKCFTLVTEEDWNKMVYDGTADENMIYVMYDDNKTMY